jgi:restriction system protein
LRVALGARLSIVPPTTLERVQQVPVTFVRELYGVVVAEHAAGGYVVTSGRFTQDAIAFAQGRNIELIDGDVLQALLLQGRQARRPQRS